MTQNLRFPIVLKPSVASILGGWVLCFLCLAASIGCFYLGVTDDWPGYVFGTGFALAFLGAAWVLIAGRTLVLDENGFTVKTGSRKNLTRWEDVDRFFVVVQSVMLIKVARNVSFNYAPHYTKQAFARNVGYALGGAADGQLASFGMKAHDLAELMNTCLAAFWSRRQRAHGTSP